MFQLDKELQQMMQHTAFLFRWFDKKQKHGVVWNSNWEKDSTDVQVVSAGVPRDVVTMCGGIF